MLQYPIAEAKDPLSKLVYQVEKGETIELTRRGRPVAVVLSEVEYRRLLQPEKSFGKALREFCAKADFEGLSNEEADKIFGDTRAKDTDQKRAFSEALNTFRHKAEQEPLGIDTSIFDADRPKESGREIEL
ncbi:MAG: type II toxin-antitoxin system Phd/YefM family antitoxin [Gammaproteobacteria bacterium]|nr:type II toxin-antitoxin system Phd/YefM family antitoxin [Gammaproteobacteria bacterium]